MKAIIISSGKELLLGQTINTNASFLGAELSKLGLKVIAQVVVDDDLAQLSDAISSAMEQSDLIITTGGLGPTDDDLTREAIASVLNESLQIDNDLLGSIEKIFINRGQKMPIVNKKQAWMIDSAQSIANPNGTAPGWLVKKDKKLIIALPGPPRELQPMWELVKKMIDFPEITRIERIYHTAGIGESQIFEVLGPIFKLIDPLVTTYAKRDGVDIRIEANGKNIKESEDLIKPIEKQIKNVLADFIYSTDQSSLAKQVITTLIAKNQTISTMESITGGFLAQEITSIPGASRCFLGGIVSYTDQSKQLFGVDPEIIKNFGAVSKETALAMAEIAKTKFNSTWSLATTGVAGPEKLEGKPVGTVCICLKGPNINEVKQISPIGDRQTIRERTISAALLLLWSKIKS